MKRHDKQLVVTRLKFLYNLREQLIQNVQHRVIMSTKYPSVSHPFFNLERTMYNSSALKVLYTVGWGVMGIEYNVCNTCSLKALLSLEKGAPKVGMLQTDPVVFPCSTEIENAV